jgi:hypothetical protein
LIGWSAFRDAVLRAQSEPKASVVKEMEQ